MRKYYEKSLVAERLRKAYEVAPSRIRQYLEAEMGFVGNRLQPSDIALELGCGYGRVLEALAPKVRTMVGIDRSMPSLKMAERQLQDESNIQLLQMDAVQLGFFDESFDCVICIQNGISAFHVEPVDLLKESIRVTKSGGLVLYSSYTENFWSHRLEWFRIQSENGLIGEIDWDASRNGFIVCKDGFRATIYNPDDFTSLMLKFDVSFEIHEIDNSSLFCEVFV